MRGDTLVTGGSDGSVRVWSLQRMAPIHRLAAHDNSITSLQFDSNRIVSGGSDGRVKIWDLRTGQQVRELSQPAEAVWRVAFEEEKAVIMATRGGRTVMEVRGCQPFYPFIPVLYLLEELYLFLESMMKTLMFPVRFGPFHHPMIL
jgi:F-box and WD-40 domain protein CDC4